MTPADVVDFVAVNAGTIVLMLLDDLDWEDPARHAAALEAKLNRYLAFVESGEIFERVPRLTPGAPVRIQIIAMEEVPLAKRPFFDYVERALRAANVEFTHEVQAP